jgi:hypothetical protein
MFTLFIVRNILINAYPPGVPDSAKSLSEKQQFVAGILENKKIASILQKLTQIRGAERIKNELKSVLENAEAHKPLFGGYQRAN